MVLMVRIAGFDIESRHGRRREELFTVGSRDDVKIDRLDEPRPLCLPASIAARQRRDCASLFVRARAVVHPARR